MWILAKILASITGKQRFFPAIEWSDNLWTHNVFRAYELVFGRRAGIRCEVSASVDKGVTTYSFHTWEAAIAHFEGVVRGLFPRRLPFRIHVPMLATPQGLAIPASPFLFAIAYDNSGIQSTAGSTPTISLTVSGSDRLMILAPDNGSGGTSVITGTTYNSVAATFLTGISFSGGTAETRQYYLVAPATGTNNAAASGTNSDIRLIASSYTGVNQSSPIDASTTQSNASTSSFVPAITTTQANCMIVVSGENNGGTATASVGTMRQAAGTGRMLGDNTAPSAGSNSMTMGGVGVASWTASVVSLAPIASAATVDALMFGHFA